MKNNFILIFLSFVLISSFVCALDYSKIEGFEIPSNIKSLVGTQKANIFIDNNFVFSVNVDKGIVHYSEILIEKPSLEVYVSQSTINKIESAENPSAEVLKAYKSGEIWVVKKTFANKIKFFFAKFFLSRSKYL